MLIRDFFSKDIDIVPDASPIIILYLKYAVCMAKNVKYTKHTSYISRRVHFVRNGEKCKLGQID